MTDEYDARYRCRWCGKWSVIPPLNQAHEQVCPANPEPT